MLIQKLHATHSIVVKQSGWDLDASVLRKNLVTDQCDLCVCGCMRSKSHCCLWYHTMQPEAQLRDQEALPTPTSLKYDVLSWASLAEEDRGCLLPCKFTWAPNMGSLKGDNACSRMATVKQKNSTAQVGLWKCAGHQPGQDP